MNKENNSIYKDSFFWFLLFCFFFSLFYFFYSLTKDEFEKFDKTLRYILWIINIPSLGVLFVYIKKYPKLKTILKIYFIIIILLLLIFSLPVYSIEYDLMPKNTNIILNKEVRTNPVHNLRLKSYKFLFVKDGYKTDSLTTKINDLIKHGSITIMLQKKKGKLYVDVNPSDANTFLRNVKSNLKEEYGMVNLIESIPYGDYWIICEKKGYSSDSVRVIIDSIFNKCKLELSIIHYQIKFLTSPNTKIFKIIGNYTIQLATTDLNGYVKLNLPYGLNKLKFKNDYDEKIIEIILPCFENQPIEVPLRN